MKRRPPISLSVEEATMATEAIEPFWEAVNDFLGTLVRQQMALLQSEQSGTETDAEVPAASQHVVLQHAAAPGVSSGISRDCSALPEE